VRAFLLLSVFLVLQGSSDPAIAVVKPNSFRASWIRDGNHAAFSAESTPVQLTIEQLVSDWYQREFGVSIPRPAIFNDERAVDCRGDGHLTSTAYLRTSATAADLFVLYLTRDGLNLIKKQRLSVVAPAGRFKVLSVVVRHEETSGPEPLAMWQAAEDAVNVQHAQFARVHGYGGPLVTFLNTNALLDSTEIRAPERPDAVVAAVQAHSKTASDYDIVIVINIDPLRSEGGRTSFGNQRFVYVGNYANWKTELDAGAWAKIARTAYQQLTAYFWGWQPDWTPTCGGTRLGFEPFITAPRLLGWEDVDGDGVPEILDENPYGRSR
jgi:hypothetical protein